MDDSTIVLTSDQGEQIECQILMTYHSDEFNRNYVFVVIAKTQEVSAYAYTEMTDSQGKLEEITDEKEWQELENVFNDYMEKMYAQDDVRQCHGGCQGCSGNCDSDDCDCDGDCDCNKM